jgi:hypothetical protein
MTKIRVMVGSNSWKDSVSEVYLQSSAESLLLFVEVSRVFAKRFNFLDRLTTHICKVAEGAEAQTHELFVERIELTEGGDVCQGAPKQSDVSFKGALTGD